jgi:transcriptional repressor NrdR
MNCPKCHKPDTKVIDSRVIDVCIRRRRECVSCSYRFTTYESPEPIDLEVKKRDGTFEPFDREKIKKSITKACNKRPICEKEIEKLTCEIEHELYTKYDNFVPSRAIGRKILEKLINIDEVAYLRFASVYKNFKNIDTFSKEITKINTQK